jgi:hypothetical protein
MLQESSTEVLDLQAQERFQSTQQETAAGMAISHLVVAADSHTPATNRQSEWVRKFFHYTAVITQCNCDHSSLIERDPE